MKKLLTRAAAPALAVFTLLNSINGAEAAQKPNKQQLEDIRLNGGDATRLEIKDRVKNGVAEKYVVHKDGSILVLDKTQNVAERLKDYNKRMYPGFFKPVVKPESPTPPQQVTTIDDTAPFTLGARTKNGVEQNILTVKENGAILVLKQNQKPEDRYTAYRQAKYPNISKPENTKPSKPAVPQAIKRATGEQTLPQTSASFSEKMGQFFSNFTRAYSPMQPKTGELAKALQACGVGGNNTSNISAYDATGKKLFHAGSVKPFEIASTTKLLVLYAYLEAVRDGKIKENTKVVISDFAAAQPPFKSPYGAGHVLSAEDAMYAVMQKSYNDLAQQMAQTLAERQGDPVAHVYPNAAAVSLLQGTAAKLGMYNTKILTTNGLPLKDGEFKHYNLSTAPDMHKLVAALKRDFPKDFQDYALHKYDLEGKTGTTAKGKVFAGINGKISVVGFCQRAVDAVGINRLMAAAKGELVAMGHKLKTAVMVAEKPSKVDLNAFDYSKGAAIAGVPVDAFASITKKLVMDESSARLDAKATKGGRDRGLMQISHAVQKAYGIKNVFDLKEVTEKYWAVLVAKHKGDFLAAYAEHNTVVSRRFTVQDVDKVANTIQACLDKRHYKSSLKTKLVVAANVSPFSKGIICGTAFHASAMASFLVGNVDLPHHSAYQKLAESYKVVVETVEKGDKKPMQVASVAQGQRGPR